MLCQNCGENEANVKYTQIINGVKKEVELCEKCSQELGIGAIDFNIPISFSSFFGDFLENGDSSYLSEFYSKPSQLLCKECGMSYEEFAQNGKFGCQNCYDVFSQFTDPLLKSLQGGERHIGRRAKVDSNSSIKKVQPKKENELKKEKTIDTLEQLKLKLKQAIKEERYEEAARIRDEIKKIENKG